MSTEKLQNPQPTNPGFRAEMAQRPFLSKKRPWSDIFCQTDIQSENHLIAQLLPKHLSTHFLHLGSITHEKNATCTQPIIILHYLCFLSTCSPIAGVFMIKTTHERPISRGLTKMEIRRIPGRRHGKCFCQKQRSFVP